MSRTQGWEESRNRDPLTCSEDDVTITCRFSCRSRAAQAHVHCLHLNTDPLCQARSRSLLYMLKLDPGSSISFASCATAQRNPSQFTGDMRKGKCPWAMCSRSLSSQVPVSNRTALLPPGFLSTKRTLFSVEFSTGWSSPSSAFWKPYTYQEGLFCLMW